MRRANDRPFTRRTALFGAAASGLVLATSRAMAQTSEGLAAPAVRSNISGFRVASWQDHFDDLRNGAILCDIDSRAGRDCAQRDSVVAMLGKQRFCCVQNGSLARNLLAKICHVTLLKLRIARPGEPRPTR